jgi:hypothetical protein
MNICQVYKNSIFTINIGCRSEQAADERDLACDACFVYPLHLPFPHYVHHLIALERPPRRLQQSL